MHLIFSSFKLIAPTGKLILFRYVSNSWLVVLKYYQLSRISGLIQNLTKKTIRNKLFKSLLSLKFHNDKKCRTENFRWSILMIHKFWVKSHEYLFQVYKSEDSVFGELTVLWISSSGIFRFRIELFELSELEVVEILSVTTAKGVSSAAAPLIITDFGMPHSFNIPKWWSWNSKVMNHKLSDS